MSRPHLLATYAAAAALVVAATLVCAGLSPYLTAPNIVLVYLLGVVVSALRLGRYPAFLSAALSVLAFNYFFVPPLYSLRVADPSHLLTFAGLLAVGAIVSSLVSTAREQGAALAHKEAQTATLYRLARELAGASDRTTALKAVRRILEGSVAGEVGLLVPAGTGLELAEASATLALGERELEIACWSRDSRRAAGWGTGSFETPGLLLLPLLAPPAILGVLAIRLPAGRDLAADRPLLEAVATQTASTLQRVFLAEREEAAKLVVARGHLERALLNSVSHDLRTPLVTITGALSGVLDGAGTLPPETQRELLAQAYEEAQRLDRFVGHLLDRTRLDAGLLKPRIEPCDLEELVGCALAASEGRLGGRPVEVRLPDPAGARPLEVPLDLALMTQVLVNLLENSARHAPANRAIEIAARLEGGALRLEVADHGPGVAEGELEHLFDRFFHVAVPERGGGTGLGLSICKGIVEAHGGSLRAAETPGGGLTVAIDLPLAASGDAGTDV